MARKKKTELEKKISKVERKIALQNQIVKPKDLPKDVVALIDTLTGQKGYLKDTEITRGQLTKIIKSAKIFTQGSHHSAALVCSSKCILVERCPLAIVNVDEEGEIDWDLMPEGQPCPVEHNVIDGIEEKYVVAYASRKKKPDETLEEAIENTRSDVFVMSLIGELVQGYIKETRINTAMATSDGGNLLMEKAVGSVNQDGEFATHLTESPYVKMLDKIHKRRSEIYKSLLLTPEMEFKKDIMSKFVDRSSSQKELIKKMNDYVLQEDEDGNYTINKKANIKTSDL